MRARSLKTTLLLWLLPLLVLTMGAALVYSSASLKQQVDVAYDRALAGALRAIDLNVSTASGGLAMEQPYLLLEFFELTANGRVYYRVATEDGLAEIGTPQLPLPRQPLVPGVPVFYEAQYLGEAVRIAALLRPMDPPIPANPEGLLIVQVAEALDTRQAFMTEVLMRVIGRDVAGIGLSLLVVIVAVVMALRPLVRLRDELDARPVADLRALEAAGLPSEVVPLVDALNLHIGRHEAQSRAQQQFLDDASHQLRTPLSVLRAQLGYALRERDPEELRLVMGAMAEGLDRAERMANQMLALARARDASVMRHQLSFSGLDLGVLAEGVLRSLMPAARARRIDLGLELQGEVWIEGIEWLLREALTNLVDNALRYTPAGRAVTVHVAAQQAYAHVRVVDAGPGMSDQDIAQAGTRFRRGMAGKQANGAGLGLAIVHAITELHRGEVRFSRIPDGPGLIVDWRLPRHREH
ncbi:sensor histidine kinase [Verticiella sediminum]|uniref:histidine kinase n=1 Tax=Verticiella sediminum TaxID=1247510 RepID=A0A556AUA0_9BURK|nr:sensor histidine kinase [Verticiella sediminum]TSH96522.1 sensor histidine kinase [Verticiella sediminum]